MLHQSVKRTAGHDFHPVFQPMSTPRLRFQRTVRRQGRDFGILTLNPGKKPYTMVMEGDALPLQSGIALQIVKVSSVEEASRYLRLLGDTCELFISLDYRRANPGVYAAARALFCPSYRVKAPFDIETAAGLMKKLPVDLKSLLKSHLAITGEDNLPCPIEKKYVHKKNSANVLISDYFQAGCMLYFNMLADTEEISFDHSSDHVQGLLMLEALRQAGVATAHIQGLSFDGGLALLNYNTNFFHYIENNVPVVLRVYCSFTADETSEDKDAPIYIQVLQYGKVVADATLKA
ncbi:MAG: hypothetical protein HGA72_07190, partial [Chlorobiaceae bacterium]|nr:hypothetical protein [Chlorobiaceae bacterium]